MEAHSIVYGGGVEAMFTCALLGRDSRPSNAQVNNNNKLNNWSFADGSTNIPSYWIPT